MSTPFGPDSPGPRFDEPSASTPTAPRDTAPPTPGVIAPELGTVEAAVRATPRTKSATGRGFAERGGLAAAGTGPRLSGLVGGLRESTASLRERAGRVRTAVVERVGGRHDEDPLAAGTPSEAVTLGGDDGRGGERRVGRDGQGGRDGRRKRQRDDIMVPPMEFTSYYGHNIVKPAPWKAEIPAYLYLGGLAAGSALVAAGGEMTGRHELQRNSRLIALAALGGSTVALVSDLGKPSRFLNMMRTVKLTSPMSVGSWILAGFGAFTGVAATSEVMRYVVPADVPGQWFWPIGDRLASLGAGALSAPLAAYTAVLLADTATPTWHASYRQLPFVFVGSALAAAGGAAIAVTDPAECAPARRMAVGGALLDLGAFQIMEGRLGLLGEPLHAGRPGTVLKAAKALTVMGAVLAPFSARSRVAGALAGAALNAGSACTRFGVFEAGMESARDPKYTVVPQRERLERRLAQTPEERAADSAQTRVAHHTGLIVSPH
ncbi:NrfD/PsrC family molybdoenzyme membrane anchor subunit [Mobilicoccus sp.]|uniref:NrfD/PsrC family molybdoenzyme membrane anchor subunit n=1 Tax=Mobilicoccus sp. TaxID=2034349 RepID=UPI0028A59341|nr:NrfD/PsrC family molybdoenzyme membrane anchor subunit [Mobilicoccus sp.]